MEIKDKGLYASKLYYDRADTKDLQNGELITFLRSGRLIQEPKPAVTRSSTQPLKKKNKQTVENTRLLMVSPSKTLENIVKANKAFRKTVKRSVKPSTTKHTLIHEIDVLKGDCKHYCQSFRQHIDMFYKFSNADKFANQLRKKMANDPSVHYRVADVLKKHAFHNINLLNDLKNI